MILGFRPALRILRLLRAAAAGGRLGGRGVALGFLRLGAQIDEAGVEQVDHLPDERVIHRLIALLLGEPLGPTGSGLRSLLGLSP